MADYDRDGLQYDHDYFGPDGNVSQIRCTLDITAARAANDVEYLMKLPNGVLVFRVEMLIRNAVSGDNVDIGTRQKGEGTWTDDDDYFFDGQSIAANGIQDSIGRRHHEALEITEDEVYLVQKYNTAKANNQRFTADYYIWYEAIGNR